MIYLDFAAATPTDKTVLRAIEPYFSDKFYNPAANYLPAKGIKSDILEAKRSIASQIGAKHTEIIHTSGGTESNNLAISGIMDRFPGKKVIISAVEHESVLRPAGKYQNELIPVDKFGMVDLKALQAMFTDDDVVLVSVMLANNETGTIQPVREIATIVDKERKDRIKKGNDTPLYLHTDACQAPCYLDIHASRLGVDFMTLNGGKIYGPKGSGILFARTGAELNPQILGGGQQKNIRSGTENPAGLIGFAKALDLAASKRREERERVGSLRELFISELEKMNQDIKINGHPTKQLPHILSVTFPGFDNERLLFQLEDADILAASGSACSASSDEPSHVLGAMGLSDETTRSSIRFSFGRQTTEKEIKQTVSTLKELIG